MFCLSKKELTAQEKVTQEWDGMAGEWDDMAGGYAAGFYDLLWKATNLDPIGDNNDRIIVDFGCGTGLLTDKLRHAAKCVIAIDAAPKMIEVVEDKIMSREWENVRAVCVSVAQLSSANETIKKMLEEEYAGKVDLIVASSVLTFVPQEDRAATMQVLGKLLKPGGGLLCHSDWPKSEAKHPDAMSTELAQQLYEMAGIKAESMNVEQMPMGGSETVDVFVGVARKS